MAPMSTCRVTIGMPVYNGGEALRSALEILLSQTEANFELVISDNASTDEVTQRITEEFARRDARVRLTRQPVNLGVVANFQWVLSQARGDYFLWAAHDDQWSHNYVEVLARCLDESPEAVLATPMTRMRTTARTGVARDTFVPPAPNADRWATLDAFVKECPCVWMYGLYRTSWVKNAGRELSNYDFTSVDMVWLFGVALTERVVGSSETTFFYSATHGKCRPRSNRQKVMTLAKEIYHLNQVVAEKAPASDRFAARRRILTLLARHRFSRRNPIGTVVHLLKLIVMGTWFGLEFGLRQLVGGPASARPVNL